jgi:thiol:disulfide interchange protein DsbD
MPESDRVPVPRLQPYPAPSRFAPAGMSWVSFLLALILLTGTAAQADASVVVTPHLRAELVSEAGQVEAGRPFWVALRLTLQPGWHTYWRNPGDSGEAPQIRWHLPQGFSAGEIQWPPPERLPVGPLMNYGNSGEAWLPVRITPPARLDTATVSLRAEARWLVCKEECIPERGEFVLTLPVGVSASSSLAPVFAALRERLPKPLVGPEWIEQAGSLRLRLAGLAADGLGGAWFFPQDYGVLAHAAPQPLSWEGRTPMLALARGEVGLDPDSPLRGVLVVSRDGPVGRTTESWALEAAPAKAAGGAAGIALAMLLALGGGLLLNLMPCVLPVLALKALHLVQHARADPARTRMSGLVFTAGVLLSFMVLAGVLLALRAGGEAVGWGFQLQSPAFVAGLAWLMMALGLWLSGVWSLGGAWMGLGQDLAARGGHGGAFFTGVLAVVVATPCTAPFMGAAVGFALAQPAAIALAVFLALGLGLALPWLVIALFPTAGRWLPRPGPWMERFKQLMAFPLYATAAWLIWVLAQQTDARGLALSLAGLVGVGLLVWLVGLGRGRLVPIAALVGGILLFGLAREIGSAGAAGGRADTGHWEAYDEARLAQLRARGQAVLVNFTAAWCITCQVNERIALDTPAVRQAMAQAGVARLKADWTRHDPALTRILEAHGRSGVPLYLLYPAGGGAPEVLPAVLTEALVLARLNALHARTPSAVAVPVQP